MLYSLIFPLNLILIYLNESMTNVLWLQGEVSGITIIRFKKYWLTFNSKCHKPCISGIHRY